VNDHDDRDHGDPGAERVGLFQGRLSPPASRPPATPAGGRRFLLRSAVDAFQARDGALYFVCACEPDRRVRAPDALDVAVVAALAAGGEHTADALAARLDAQAAVVATKLEALAASGLVCAFDGPETAELTDEERERFSRQLAYLAEFGDPLKMQGALRAAHLLVIGTGGLGSWCIAALASAGIGTFTLVDDDVVELSNLNRQILFGSASVGRPKVTETAAWLKRFDATIRVVAHERRVAGRRDVAALLDGVDLVVMAADTPAYEITRWTNAACMEAGVPFVTAGLQLPLVRVGATHIPGVTACFDCHERELRAESALYDDYVRHVQTSPRWAVTTGAAMGIAGSMIGVDIQRLLLSGRCETAGRALTIDVSDLAVRRAVLNRDPRCSTCQDLEPWRSKVTGSTQPR
jgi:bacteriocin biosynthesis cyclodehydratase domain-containing protein